LTKSFAESSEAASKGYMMSKRVDKKVQSKIKSLEVSMLCIFPGAGKFGEGVTPNDGDT
jgi:hypothetical protein